MVFFASPASSSPRARFSPRVGGASPSSTMSSSAGSSCTRGGDGAPSVAMSTSAGASARSGSTRGGTGDSAAAAGDGSFSFSFALPFPFPLPVRETLARFVSRFRVGATPSSSSSSSSSTRTGFFATGGSSRNLAEASDSIHFSSHTSEYPLNGPSIASGTFLVSAFFFSLHSAWFGFRSGANSPHFSNTPNLSFVRWSRTVFSMPGTRFFTILCLVSRLLAIARRMSASVRPARIPCRAAWRSTCTICSPHDSFKYLISRVPPSGLPADGRSRARRADMLRTLWRCAEQWGAIKADLRFCWFRRVNT